MRFPRRLFAAAVAGLAVLTLASATAVGTPAGAEAAAPDATELAPAAVADAAATAAAQARTCQQKQFVHIARTSFGNSWSANRFTCSDGTEFAGLWGGIDTEMEIYTRQGVSIIVSDKLVPARVSFNSPDPDSAYWKLHGLHDNNSWFLYELVDRFGTVAFVRARNHEGETAFTTNPPHAIRLY